MLRIIHSEDILGISYHFLCRLLLFDKRRTIVSVKDNGSSYPKKAGLEDWMTALSTVTRKEMRSMAVS